MHVSQKARYALRAAFELAKRYGQGPVKISDIAGKQAIPLRFLEVILGQMKNGGFVSSRRGSEGGYVLSRHPSKVTVADILQFVDGPIEMVRCAAPAGRKEDCPLEGSCVFMSMWQRAGKAVLEVYDRTTLESLVEEETKHAKRAVDYAI